MGADLYLNSLYRPFEEEQKKKPLSKPLPDEGPIEFANRLYEEQRASGGYFRNGYNGGDIMWAMGLSWNGTVSSMLDDTRHLPIPKARELVEMVEARPLTREVVGAHIFEHMTGGVEPKHPVHGGIQQKVDEAIAAETGKPVPEKLPPDFDETFTFLNTRRDQFLAILRKSIELDEPLQCSL